MNEEHELSFSYRLCELIKSAPSSISGEIESKLSGVGEPVMLALELARGRARPRATNCVHSSLIRRIPRESSGPSILGSTLFPPGIITVVGLSLFSNKSQAASGTSEMCLSISPSSATRMRMGDVLSRLFSFRSLETASEFVASHATPQTVSDLCTMTPPARKVRTASNASSRHGMILIVRLISKLRSSSVS